MYLGQIVELASDEELYKNPQHPYTEALLSLCPFLIRRSRKTDHPRRRCAESINPA
jgi:oligopeptide/dipeptide ABC transporter ATP-binding protein